MIDESQAPLTRRQLRERRTPTERRAERQTVAPAPERRRAVTPPLQTPATPVGGPLPTRRAIREAERAACPPPFAALVRLPRPAAVRLNGAWLHGGVLAKSGVLVALSGALVLTSVGGMSVGADRGGDGLALRAAADRAAVQQAQALALQERADSAASSRLSAAAAAYASAKRAEAVLVAQATLEAATLVSTEVQPIVDEPTLTRLAAAAAELEALVEVVQAPTARLSDVTDQATVVATETEPASESASTRADNSAPAPADATVAPATGAPEAGPSRTSREQDRPASRGTRPVPTEADATAEVTAPSGPSATTDPTDLVDAPPAPMQTTGDPEVLAAEANKALEHVGVLMHAAAGLEAVVAEVSETAAAVVAEQEAARAAAAELARKIAVVKSSPNGGVPADVLCAPAFAPDARLRCDAAAALERLNAAYRADHGRDLKVVSSYRSYSAQVSTRASRGSLAATPGTSNHGRGIAVDLGGFGSVGQFNDPDYLWMRQHAGDHGWFHPAIMRPGGGGPLEPWHWEFGTE